MGKIGVKWDSKIDEVELYSGIFRDFWKSGNFSKKPPKLVFSLFEVGYPPPGGGGTLVFPEFSRFTLVFP